MSIKPKLSSLVSGQLPEFIRGDYQTFVTFMEAYYEFLETQIVVDFDEISNIDTTLDAFVKYFKDEVALNFPSTLVNDRFLLPKLKELYISKGEEASYRLLFRILYNKEIELRKPAEQMLKVSDGKWIQDISVFSTIVTGSPDDIVGKTINIISSDRKNIKKIKVFVDRYELSDTPGVYEFFIMNGFTGTFNVGDLLSYGNIFTGVVIATTSTLKIDQPGKNFKVGQTYDIGGAGIGSIMRVDGVSGTGGIKVARFINFGTGYPNTFTTDILAVSNQISNIQNFFTITGSSPSYTATIEDSINQLNDQGVFNTYNYAITSGLVYVDGTYAGNIVKSFVNAPASVYTDPTDYAKITVNNGSVAKYPCYYKNNDGFLDDTMFIQDSKYYQTFSYSIQIDEIFESYKSVLKNLVHPAGTEIIGEYVVTNVLDAEASVGINTLEYSFNLITESSGTFIAENAVDSIIVIV